MAIITLTTDFGIQDEYAGVLKGVIAVINPQANVIDLTHGIDPQDVVQATYLLRAAYGYFPAGTIHLAIVDPGVGSQRSIIAALYRGYCFVAPDNGLLPGIWSEGPPDLVVKVTNEDLFLHPVSSTFHGRDIFAPVAAHLSLGMALGEFGPALSSDQLTRLTPSVGESENSQLCGRIVAIDHFGNLITNITAAQLNCLADEAGSANINIQVGDHLIKGLSGYYAQVPAGRSLALIGSRALLEIAVNGASAAAHLQLSKGAVVRVGTVQPTDELL